MQRSSGGLSILNSLNNARLLRIDNHESKTLVTFGSDQWKVFPWLRRNTEERGAVTSVNHSGTFGFAIRYEV